jgi:hypothetical protein
LICAVAVAAAGCGRDDPQAERRAQQPRPAAGAQAAPAAADQAGVTPMAERVAVLGLLNKRNGIVRDLTIRPGQAIRVKDAVVRLRACETTAPWEFEQLTGAFVQLDVQRTDRRWQRVFSGWIYKESPSLNTVEHPVYDVWPKSCAMTYPAAPGAPAAPDASSNRSSARKSGGASPPRARPEPATPPRAAANNLT